MIEKHNPGWKLGNYAPGGVRWPARPRQWRFRAIARCLAVDYDIPYSHDARCGRIRASAGVSASLGRDEVVAFDVEHAAMLKRDFPDDLMQVPHRVAATWGRKSLELHPHAVGELGAAIGRELRPASPRSGSRVSCAPGSP